VKNQDTYTVIPFPKIRRFAIDAGVRGRRKHIVHGLLEVDVTQARQYIREHKARTGESLSFTAFVITCLGKAVEMNKIVQACRTWRDQLIIFDDVDVNTMVEVETDGDKVPMPHILKAVNRRTYREIQQEIREAKSKPASTQEFKFMRLFLFLPGFVRQIFYWAINQNPRWMRTFPNRIMVTSVGMFGEGTAWGIPMASFPLTVTLGSIAKKPGVVDGCIEIREYLCVTLSFDHDVIDGAPAARFTQQFRELIESGYGLCDHDS
jgi:pyruvate/2-oxoglutarate dehydrogenase complex dihydrolipoamide acyltransferase (E2) component